MLAQRRKKAAMPTVLDLLKKHLLGDEVADRLEQALASWNAMTAPTSVTPVSDRADLQWSADMQTDKPIPIFEALRTPSPGYEALLMEAGWGQLAARGMAKLAVGHGKRRAKESTWYRPVFDAIRFLAKRPRQRRAILRCARLLLNAWNETSIIETIFDEAGVNETEFIRLLEDVMEGRQADLHHITEIAE